MFENYKQMKPSRKLSRLSITGHISEQTPICVLMEIADAHGMKIEKKDYEMPNFAQHLLICINEASVPTVSIGEINEISQWQFIARFVNKYSEWPQGKLLQAYNFLIDFMNNDDPLIKIPGVFTVGLQTPDTPFSINACLLYKTCVYHRLTMNPHTTITQMAYAVKLLREDIASVMRRAVKFVERDAKRIDLINTLMISPHEIQDPKPPVIDQDVDFQIIPKINVSYDLMVRIHESLNDLRSLQEKFDPCTPPGSIALAAINFNIDISKSSNPISEYKILKVCGRNNYRPGDTWMCHWYERNPVMFDLTVTFNPLFPMGFYNNNILSSMVENEGYTPSEIAEGNPYELLQLAYVSETFYQGEMPNLKSTVTPIELDDINSVPYGQLLCYGQLDSPLRVISMSELIQLFEVNQNFSSPFGSDSIFSSTSINKLKLIARSPSGSNPTVRISQETVQVRSQLLDAIDSIEILSRNLDEPSRQLSFAYRISDPDTKRAIITALTNLLHLGMFMRGWSGSGNFPVRIAEVPLSRDMEVAVNVTDAIAKYESCCRSLGKIGTQINNLPLVLYKDSEYQVSTASYEGITIGERIQIVKGGDRISNVSSCIRLSSNWLCSSAHKYMIAIGLPSPFDIFYLRHIA